MAEKKKEVELRVKVVTIGDYLVKVEGDDKYAKAIALLYSENKVIDKIESKGNIYFIVEK